MARKVKCRICGNYGTNETFYKVKDNNGKNKYYCNEEEYLHYENEKLKRENLLSFIAKNILELEEGQIINPIMIKKLNELHSFYDYEVILKTFEINKDTIKYWMGTKNFTSEFGMISYIMRIIERNINDVYKQWKFRKQQEVKQNNDTVNIDILNETDVIKTVKNNDNGILDFLEEDDM